MTAVSFDLNANTISFSKNQVEDVGTPQTLTHTLATHYYYFTFAASRCAGDVATTVDLVRRR